MDRIRKVGILVVSDTRAKAFRSGNDVDISGKIIEEKLRKIGYITVRTIVSNNKRSIKIRLKKFIKDPNIGCVFITGGTGVSRRDVTIETIEPMYSKNLPGIGETLRRIGYKKVGFPALLSRTSAGIIDRKPVFCLPGTPGAVKTALDLLLPNLDYLLRELER